MTHHSAAYHPQIDRRLIALLVLAAVPLAACGGAKSTLPPAPSRADNVAIRNLAHHPEVYADATVATVGRVARVNGPKARPLYQLLGGHGKRIVLEPSAKAARYLGHRVRASGIFTVTFALGYEILISRIAPVGTL